MTWLLAAFSLRLLSPCMCRVLELALGRGYSEEQKLAWVTRVLTKPCGFVPGGQDRQMLQVSKQGRVVVLWFTPHALLDVQGCEWPSAVHISCSVGRAASHHRHAGHYAAYCFVCRFSLEWC